jgi:hypothetical protein
VWAGAPPHERNGCPVMSRSARLALGSFLFTVAVVLPLFRQTGIPSWQTIWAEDASIWFQQARREGGLALLLRGYAGYLQFPPRVLGALSTLVPIEYLSIYMALTGTLVGALLAWFTYWATAGWISSTPLRLALASLIVLMPIAGEENTACIANVNWVCTAVLPWALLSTAEGRRDVIVRGVVAFLAATSTVLCVVFLPLAIGYALLRRTRAGLRVAAAFCVGLAVQVSVTLTEHSVFPFSNSVVQLARLVSVRVFAAFLIGDKGIDAAWLSHSRLLVVGAPIVAAVLFACLFAGAGRRGQALAATFLAYAVISFVVPVWVRGTASVPMLEGHKYFPPAQPRFGVIPEFLLASAVAVLIAPSGPNAHRLMARIARPVFIAQIALLAVVGFSVTNLRSAGPAWASALNTAYEKDCSGTASDTLVTVQTNRFNWWPVELPCRELTPTTVSTSP